MGADDIRKRFARKFTLEMWKAVTTLTTLNLLKKKKRVGFSLAYPVPVIVASHLTLAPSVAPSIRATSLVEAHLVSSLHK